MVWFYCFWYQIKAGDSMIQFIPLPMEKIKVMQFYMQIKWIYLNNTSNTITFIIIDVILLLLSILLLTREPVLNKYQTSQKKETKRESIENKTKRKKYEQSFLLFFSCPVLLCVVLVCLQYVYSCISLYILAQKIFWQW